MMSEFMGYAFMRHKNHYETKTFKMICVLPSGLSVNNFIRRLFSLVAMMPQLSGSPGQQHFLCSLGGRDVQCTMYSSLTQCGKSTIHLVCYYMEFVLTLWPQKCKL